MTVEALDTKGKKGAPPLGQVRMTKDGKTYFVAETDVEKAQKEGYELKLGRNAKAKPAAPAVSSPASHMVTIPPEMLKNRKTYLELPTQDLEYIIKLAQDQIRAQQEQRVQAWKDETVALFMAKAITEGDAIEAVKQASKRAKADTTV